MPSLKKGLLRSTAGDQGASGSRATPSPPIAPALAVAASRSQRRGRRIGEDRHPISVRQRGRPDDHARTQFLGLFAVASTSSDWMVSCTHDGACGAARLYQVISDARRAARRVGNADEPRVDRGGIQLIDSFVRGEISALEFERIHLQMFQEDPTMRPEAEFSILDRLFA